MPYIEPEKRDKFKNILSHLACMNLSIGEINYFISAFLHDLILKRGCCYAMLNSIIGMLECAKQEFYRQIVAPYEDKKQYGNGPVSELDK